jgi:hypothetical protein
MAIHQTIVRTDGNSPDNCPHSEQFIWQLFALLTIHQAIIRTDGNSPDNCPHSKQFFWQLFALQDTFHGMQIIARQIGPCFTIL